MDFNRALQYIILNIEPLFRMMLFAAGVTVIVLVLLTLLAGSTWFDKRSFGFLGVFYGSGNYECFRLAISWLRFLMTVYFIVAFKELEVSCYVAYFMVGLLYVLDIRNPKRIIKNLIWFLIVAAGLYASNLVCAYIHSLSHPDVKTTVIYVFMGLFMCLFSFYLLMQEIDDISGDRLIDPEKEYEQTGKDN